MRLMSMQSTNQYLEVLRKEYLKSSKKEKTKLLEEAKKRTGLVRKYLIVKLSCSAILKKKEKQKRSCCYDGEVKAALAVSWKIFDHPCGQRLIALLKTETERLRKLGELKCSDEVADKLRKISFRSIDDKLRHEKEVEHLKRKYHKSNNPLLYQKIPVKLSGEWDRSKCGNIQIDSVEHCGQSAFGEFVNTVSSTDISIGWWEGGTAMGRGQARTLSAIKSVRARFPFPWIEVHPDNGSEFLNWHLWEYTQEEHIAFSRSRPNKKNDNCFIEQKNRTHVREIVGHLRYDTVKEQEIINDLYQNELRLYKNFFQPIIKLISKERINGHIKRKYDQAKTPYHRVLESKDISENVKDELRKIYESLNPAELKRNIDKKLANLYEAYCEKNKSAEVEISKKLKPSMVRNLIAESMVKTPVSVR